MKSNRQFQTMRKRTIYTLLLILLMVGCAGIGGKFWKKKPYTQWTRTEVQEFLYDSPWVKKCKYTIPEMAIITRDRGPRSATVDVRKAIPKERHIRDQIFYISWISALPWKLAMVRYAELLGQPLDALQVEWFLNNPERYIRINITTDNPEIFLTIKKSKILKETYLQTKTGKRIPLLDYHPPIRETRRAALFIFPREEDGKLLISPEDREVTFHTRLDYLSIECKFKLKDMVVNGKLEI